VLGKEEKEGVIKFYRRKTNRQRNGMIEQSKQSEEERK
jgi:hypothetical protein